MAVANAYAMQMTSMPPPPLPDALPPATYPAPMGSTMTPGFNNVVQWITDRSMPMQPGGNFPPFPHQALMQSKE